MVRLGLCAFAALSLAGCNVSNNAKSTGGVQVGGACPQALSVVNTDYKSTNISLVGVDGKQRSESVLSSGSAPAGLTTALSGDVVLPSSRPASDRLVVIDRSNAALTWVTADSAKVLAQFSVGTGFSANPHDYLEITETKAYVTRYESNPTPGQHPFDAGGDLLVVDSKNFKVTGRVALPTDGDATLLPRADRMLEVDDHVWVVLQRLNADFSVTGDSQLVGVDSKTDTVAWKLDLPKAAACSGFARSPSGDVVALTCSGAYTDTDPLSRSTIVLLDATASPPTELKRLDVAQKLGRQLGPSIAFARDDLLVGVVAGDGKTTNDSAFSLDVTTGKATALADAKASFVFGDVLCDPGCTDHCWLADADSKVLRQWAVGSSALNEAPNVSVDPSIGLPPRTLGSL